ncbi:MAG: MFS transporter [Pseudonocardiales bacterium]|nr:MAG: MFS transporter [Pseudonocardiales bacterium]
MTAGGARHGRFRGTLAGLPTEVRALIIVAFMVALGYGIVAPAIPLFARQFGVGKAAAGAVISAFALMRLLTAPFVGRLVNAFGERVMLATGIIVVAISSLLAGFAQEYWQLLVLRGIGGVGSIMFSVSAASILIRVTPSHLRGRAQGAWAGSFLIGMIAGPAVGTVATFSLRAPFFLYAGTLVVAGTLALSTLRHSKFFATKQVEREAPLPLQVALRNRAYVAALAASFAGDWAVVGARSAIVPQFVTDRLELGAGWVYAAFLVVSIVSGALLLPFGRVADSRGRRPVILIGLVIGAVGFILLPTVPTVVGLLVAMALLGVAGAADSVAPGALMGDVVGGRGGTVVAVFQMSGDLGAVIGPVAAGWIADGFGYPATFLVSAAVSIAPLPLVARAPETLVPAPSPEPPTPLCTPKTDVS